MNLIVSIRMPPKRVAGSTGLAILVATMLMVGCGRNDSAGVLLEWLPPSEYDDGGVMPEGTVTAFRIYVDQEMVQQLEPTVTEYFLELPTGEWQGTISAVASGVESRLSEPLDVVID